MKNTNVFLKISLLMFIGLILNACYKDFDDLTSQNKESYFHKHELEYSLNNELKIGTITSIKYNKEESIQVGFKYENKGFGFYILLSDIIKDSKIFVSNDTIRPYPANYTYGQAHYYEYDVPSTLYQLDSTNTNFIMIESMSKRFVKGSFDLKYRKKDIDTPGLDTVHIKSDFFKAHRYRSKT